MQGRTAQKSVFSKFLFQMWIAGSLQFLMQVSVLSYFHDVGWGLTWFLWGGDSPPLETMFYPLDKHSPTITRVDNNNYIDRSKKAFDTIGTIWFFNLECREGIPLSANKEPISYLPTTESIADN